MHKTIRLAAILTAFAATASAQLIPSTFTFTWTRAGNSDYASTNVYMSETTYWGTQCLARVSGVAQDLTSVGGYVRVGDATTNRLFAIWIEDATNGQFGFSFTIPTRAATASQADVMTAEIQFVLTNATVTVIDPERKKLYYRKPLQ
jgi:hypothetical protein